MCCAVLFVLCLPSLTHEKWLNFRVNFDDHDPLGSCMCACRIMRPECLSVCAIVIDLLPISNAGFRYDCMAWFTCTRTRREMLIIWWIAIIMNRRALADQLDGAHPWMNGRCTEQQLEWVHDDVRLCIPGVWRRRTRAWATPQPQYHVAITLTHTRKRFLCELSATYDCEKHTGTACCVVYRTLYYNVSCVFLTICLMFDCDPNIRIRTATTNKTPKTRCCLGCETARN